MTGTRHGTAPTARGLPVQRPGSSGGPAALTGMCMAHTGTGTGTAHTGTGMAPTGMCTPHTGTCTVSTRLATSRSRSRRAARFRSRRIWLTPSAWSTKTDEKATR